MCVRPKINVFCFNCKEEMSISLLMMITIFCSVEDGSSPGKEQNKTLNFIDLRFR